MELGQAFDCFARYILDRWSHVLGIDTYELNGLSEAVLKSGQMTDYLNISHRT